MAFSHRHDGDGFITAGELEESLNQLGIAVSAAELYDSIAKKRKQQLPAVGDGSGAEDARAEVAGARLPAPSSPQCCSRTETPRGARALLAPA